MPQPSSWSRCWAWGRQSRERGAPPDPSPELGFVPAARLPSLCPFTRMFVSSALAPGAAQKAQDPLSQCSEERAPVGNPSPFILQTLPARAGKGCSSLRALCLCSTWHCGATETAAITRIYLCPTLTPQGTGHTYRSKALANPGLFVSLHFRVHSLFQVLLPLL